jgi:hypothetical protein
MFNRSRIAAACLRPRRSLACVALQCLCCLYLLPLITLGAVWPLKVAPGARYLQDQDGIPFLINADSPWSLAVALTKEEAELYLEDRRQKGFNALIVELIEHKFGGVDNRFGSPRNRYGHGPFLIAGDFSTPNEDYFSHADWIIDRAADKGMLVLLTPCYLGYPSTNEGWYNNVLANGVEVCREFGRYVGARYRNRSNILWVLGGDRNPDAARPMVNAIAEGIRAEDPDRLMTAHCIRGQSSRQQYPDATWLSVNSVYERNPVQKGCLATYEERPAMPFILIEGWYENEHRMTAAAVRSQAYSALLAGACGQAFGNYPVWGFDQAWRTALDSSGAFSMMHLQRLFLSRRWFELEPDLNHSVIVAGYGKEDSTDWVGCARARDGATVIAYLPESSKPITVDLSKVSGSEVKAWWFNPRDGTVSVEGRYPTGERRQFTRPTSEDWVLVIDDASRKLSAPGTPGNPVKAGQADASPVSLQPPAATLGGTAFRPRVKDCRFTV